MYLFNFIAANDNGFKLTPWCVSDAFTSCSIFQFPCHICTPCTLYLNIQPTSVRWLIGFLQHICHLHSPPPSPWPFLLSSPFLFLFLPPLVFPLILRLNLSSFLLFPLLPLSLFLSYLLSPPSSQYLPLSLPLTIWLQTPGLHYLVTATSSNLMPLLDYCYLALCHSLIYIPDFSNKAGPDVRCTSDNQRWEAGMEMLLWWDTGEVEKCTDSGQTNGWDQRASPLTH